MKQKSENIEYRPSFPKMETGFKTPEGYFESFEYRLKLRIEAEQQASSRRRKLIFYLKPALGLAAGLAILLTIYRFPPGLQEKASEIGIQNVSALHAEESADPLISTFASQITDSQLITAISEMDEYDASKMPKDELEDYLATNCSDSEILNANK